MATIDVAVWRATQEYFRRSRQNTLALNDPIIGADVGLLRRNLGVLQGAFRSRTIDPLIRLLNYQRNKLAEQDLISKIIEGSRHVASGHVSSIEEGIKLEGKIRSTREAIRKRKEAGVIAYRRSQWSEEQQRLYSLAEEYGGGPEGLAMARDTIAREDANKRARQRERGRRTIAEMKSRGQYAFWRDMASPEEVRMHDLTMKYGGGTEGRFLAEQRLGQERAEEQERESRRQALQMSHSAWGQRKERLMFQKEWPLFFRNSRMSTKDIRRMSQILGEVKKIPGLGLLVRGLQNPVALAGMAALQLGRYSIAEASNRAAERAAGMDRGTRKAAMYALTTYGGSEESYAKPFTSYGASMGELFSGIGDTKFLENLAMMGVDITGGSGIGGLPTKKEMMQRVASRIHQLKTSGSEIDENKMIALARIAGFDESMINLALDTSGGTAFQSKLDEALGTYSKTSYLSGIGGLLRRMGTLHWWNDFVSSTSGSNAIANPLVQSIIPITGMLPDITKGMEVYDLIDSAIRFRKEGIGDVSGGGTVTNVILQGDLVLPNATDADGVVSGLEDRARSSTHRSESDRKAIATALDSMVQ